MGISELLRGNAAQKEHVSDLPSEDVVAPDEDALTPDPEPAHRASRSRTPKTERPKGKLPTTAAGKKKMETQVRDNLTMFLGLGSLMGTRVDPHCFGALAMQQEAIVNALVPIIMRNTNLLRWFAGTDAHYLEYLALAQALAPVGMTVFKHHIAKSVGEGGARPAHAYDLSDFAAPAFV